MNQRPNPPRKPPSGPAGELESLIRNWPHLSPDAKRRIAAIVERHEENDKRIVPLPRRPR